MDLLKRGQNRHSPLRPEGNAEDFLPIKAAKKKDLDELLMYVEESIREAEFYKSIRPSPEAVELPDEYEA